MEKISTVCGSIIDATGKARQVDRVTYGSDEAKILN